MRIPIIRGLIDRRILVNFHVDPDVLAKVLPQPFRPKLVNGVGVAGVCLIRLKHIRPRFWPAMLGVSSENAAHRIAVQWEAGDELREGVYIPRRDTSSRLNSLVGGRLFPGRIITPGSVYTRNKTATASPSIALMAPRTWRLRAA